MPVSSPSKSVFDDTELDLTTSFLDETEVSDYVPVKEEFKLAVRQEFGTMGRPIPLRTNHFLVRVPSLKVHHYHVEIEPESARKVNRDVFSNLINSFTMYFVGTRPVYDGQHSMYTRRPLPIGHDKTEFDVKLPSGERVFKVSLKWVTDIESLEMSPETTYNHPLLSQKAYHAINTILRHLSSSKYTPLGHCFFSPPGTDALLPPRRGFSNRLGYGREVWFGFHQHLQPTQWKWTVNIDTATTAFHCSIPVLEFLAEFLEVPVQVLSEKDVLSDAQRIRFTREIRGLRVEITHCGSVRRKYRVTGLTRRCAQTQTFVQSLDNEKRRETTVVKYFREKYGLDLKYSHLPLLTVGKDSARTTFLPMEVCRIVQGQRVMKKLSETQTSLMIRAAQMSAPEREREIEKLVVKTELHKDPFMEEYGISIGSKMKEAKGRVLPAPKIMFAYNETTRQQQSVTPLSGVWDIRGRQLHTGVNVHTWAIVSFATPAVMSEPDLRRLANAMQTVSKVNGMPISRQPVFCKYAAGVAQVEPMFKFIKATHPGLQIIFVVLPGKTSCYAEIKKVGDTILGIPTQCIALRNAVRPSAQTLSNIFLKMNVKLGGVNSIVVPHMRPAVFSEPVIFLGVDVSHPQGDVSVRRPTITAVVGSIDAHPSRYAAAVRIQPTQTELVTEMNEMVRSLLLKFRKCTGFRPMRIVVYRCGLSEGQFYNALQHELRAIRESCQMIEADYQPAITIIAVQRRHHTRLFAADPEDYQGRSNNVPAGTVLDYGITHPVLNDFFLCSHNGVQGTSRPTRYHVLWDDSHLSADDLHQMTFQLCHTYARSTRSISVPAPIYYANLVATRARYHLVEKTETESSFVDSLHSTTSSERSATISGMVKAIQVHPNISESMYYC